MIDWHREYRDLVKKLWQGYTVYVSAGMSYAAFVRHIWPVIREARQKLQDTRDKPTE